MARSLRLKGTESGECAAVWGEGNFGKVSALAFFPLYTCLAGIKVTVCVNGCNLTSKTGRAENKSKRNVWFYFCITTVTPEELTRHSSLSHAI